MTMADVMALVKGLEKKVRAGGDLADVLQSIEEISAALTDDDAPTMRVPYVNASPIDTGAWK